MAVAARRGMRGITGLGADTVQAIREKMAAMAKMAGLAKRAVVAGMRLQRS